MKTMVAITVIAAWAPKAAAQVSRYCLETLVELLLSRLRGVLALAVTVQDILDKSDIVDFLCLERLPLMTKVAQRSENMAQIVDKVALFSDKVGNNHRCLEVLATGFTAFLAHGGHDLLVVFDPVKVGSCMPAAA